MCLDFDQLHFGCLQMLFPITTKVIKSKDEVVMHAGFRRFSSRPIFSEIPRRKSSEALLHALRCVWSLKVLRSIACIRGSWFLLNYIPQKRPRSAKKYECKVWSTAPILRCTFLEHCNTHHSKGGPMFEERFTQLIPDKAECCSVW